MIRALTAALARIVGQMRETRPSAPPVSVPPAFCRKIVRDRAWTWADCTHPFCGCKDGWVTAEATPPVKHRDLYAEHFDVEG